MGTSIWQRFGVMMGTAAVVLFSSLPVQATLIGNEVLTTLIQTEPLVNDVVLDNVATTVSDTDFEFFQVTGSILDGIEWTLDLQAEGFSLLGFCTSDGTVGEPQCFDGSSSLEDSIVSLSLTGLTWDPIPGSLVGVNITQAREIYDSDNIIRDFVVDTSITSSSMDINFALLGLNSLGDSVTVTGEFLTIHVPEPSILALMGIGFLSLPLLRRRQTKPE